MPKSYVKLNTESPRKPETFTIGELGLIGQHIPHRYFPKRERGPTRHYRQRSQHVRNLSPVYKEEPKLLSTTITTPRTTYNYSTPISLKSPYPLTRNDFYIMHNTPKPKKHYSPVILVEDEVRELEPIYNPRLTQTSHHKRDVSHVVNIGISTDS